MFRFADIKKKFSDLKLMEGDPVVWMILIVLCIISVVEVYSASSRDSYSAEHYFAPVIKHGGLVLFSLLCAWGAHKVPYRAYKPILGIGLVISFFLMIYAMCFSASLNDTQRWVNIAGVSIQPSEVVKVTLIGFTATVFASFRTKKGRPTNGALETVCVVAAVFLAMIMVENFSTAAILGTVIFGMMWIADANRKFIAIVAAFLVIGGTLGFMTIKSMSEETVESISSFQVGQKKPLKRFSTWAHRLQKEDKLPENPMDYDITDNIQVTHAKIALARSRVIGRGPGKSVERDYIPQANCDFIYAIIIEEGGIECGLLVLGLYLLLLYRAWKIAKNCAARFPAYFVMGLAMMMVLQAMVNMAVAVSAMPVTGQPLPLVSKGGSSGVITCIYIGMILGVSRSARKVGQPKKKKELALSPTKS